MNDIKEKMKMAYIKTFRIINKCFCLKKIEETKSWFSRHSQEVYTVVTLNIFPKKYMRFMATK